MDKKERSNEEHYRDKMNNKEKGTLRIYFQNVNELTCKEEIYKYTENMKEYNVDIWRWTETNLNWPP